VLFSVASYAEYGRLSGRSVEDMIAGARVEVAPYKRDPMDFVLWKPSEAGVPGWDSPWGRGRPGWHIECSAMARELLGESFDIHGGGIDLQFPHHENEIAQSACAHPEGDFAKVWLHNEMLLVEGKKMSKSLGNFFTVRDLLEKGVPGEVIRFVLLSTHYRSPMDWTERKREEAEGVLHKWRALTAGVTPANEPLPQVTRCIEDDLNVAAAIAELHQLAHAHDAPNLLASARLLGLLTTELGGWEKKGPAEGADLSMIDDLCRRLQLLREAAVATRDFSEVDAMKRGLVDAGIDVRMTKSGIELVPTATFRRDRLEALK